MKLFFAALGEIVLYLLLEIALIAWHPFMLRYKTFQDATTTRYFEFDWLIVLFLLNCVFCLIAGIAKSKKGIAVALITFVIAILLGAFYFHFGPITLTAGV